MYFDSLHSVVVMEGHGVYVWAAYAVTVLVVVATLAIPVRRQKRLLGQLAAEDRRARGAPAAGEAR